jgi:hypothetical protein
MLPEEQKGDVVSEVVKNQMQALLQAEPLSHAALAQHIHEKYPTTPPTPSKVEKWYHYLPFVSLVDGLRDVGASARRSVQMLDTMLVRAEEEGKGLLHRGMYDVAEKMVVNAKNEPDGTLAKVNNHLLGIWEEHQQYATDMTIYNQYKTRGMKKPELPRHPLEAIESLAAESVIFRELEDHLGNLIQVHLSKSPVLNKAIEAGIDLGAGKLIDVVRRKVTESFVGYLAIATAKHDPETMQQILQRQAEHAYQSLENSKYPKMRSRQATSSQ